MTSKQENVILRRESILELLSDDETAKVSRAEETSRLVDGDEYVDLEDLASGVHRVQGTTRVAPGRALPRSAVSEGTWTRILKTLTK